MADDRKIIGKAVSRIDGLLKVTGGAKYATDYKVNNVAYAVIFKSEIAAGKILDIDARAAEKSAGVLTVITHKNAPKLNKSEEIRGGALLQSPDIEFYGQHIGIVVAETFEQARYASRLIKVKYQKANARTDFEKLKTTAVKSKEKDRQDAVRGDVESVFNSADVKVEAVYETPIEHHQPMEPHATLAVWDGNEKVILYNGSQIVNGVQQGAAETLGLKPENVRILTSFIGGGFGSKGAQWSNVVLTAVAARFVKRPVKLALMRQQMFNSVGLRQRNNQRLRLAASKDGKLTAVSHETVTHTATNDEFIEPCGDCSKILYDSPNSLITYRVTPMNVIVPTYQRAPGKSTGSFALESAIDELAYKLKIDPVELRLKNEPAKDPSNGKPWSSRSLVQCLKKGAEAIGWDKRKIEPKQNRNGNYLVGYGVGCGTYPARQRDTSAIIKLNRKGDDVRASVELAASDLGTGTYTILAQIAAETLGLKLEKIDVKIGDSALPPAAGSVGSVGAASFSNAVFEGCNKITDELIVKSGKNFIRRPTAAELMISEEITDFQTRVDSKPIESANEFSTHAFNANFCEVWVNESTGTVKLPRIVAVVGAGKILNPKTAGSQIIGGVVWGVGMALTEESVIDARYGNFITRTLADYHVPVNLDIGEIEPIFIEEDDKQVNQMGIKGVGEIGIIGVAAAIANAIFNATGKRVRSLPVTPDKLF